MMQAMDAFRRLALRWWKPLAVGGVGIVLLVAPSTARWVAFCCFALAAWLTIGAARSREASDSEATELDGPMREPMGDEERIALAELAHERDVSIARAAEAEDRERLARDRLTALAPLERRIEIAERRAHDAERRLDEIGERVDLALRGDDGPGEGDEPGGDAGPDGEEPGGGSGSDPTPGAPASDADELRARLARSAARRKPGADR
jgi:hypothetical protein